MDVIAFAASPRMQGNSETLLDYVINGLKDSGASVEKVRIHERVIAPCTSCGSCHNTGRCIIQDDFQVIYDRLIECDAVVFATPLYFMNVPASGKALIDRCQSFWIAKHRLNMELFGIKKRYGLVAAVSGAGYGPDKSFVFRGLMDTMTYLFDALGLAMMDSVFVRRVDAKAAIQIRHDDLQEGYRAGCLLVDAMHDKRD